MCVRYKINNQRLSAISHTTSFNVDDKYKFNLNFLRGVFGRSECVRKKPKKNIKAVTFSDWNGYQLRCC
jgi:hypothetical protein